MNKTTLAPIQTRVHSKSFTYSTSLTKPIQSKNLEKSFEEITRSQQLTQVEMHRLDEVYRQICGTAKGITLQSILDIMDRFEFPISKHEARGILWEVDEDNDEVLYYDDFILMYKRCTFDQTFMEPRTLFNIVQFLMFDKHQLGRITVEDTLQLIFVRVGKFKLDEEIYSIFGSEEKTTDGQEKSISFSDYFEKMKLKDFDKRKIEEEKKAKYKLPSLDDTK